MKNNAYKIGLVAIILVSSIHADNYKDLIKVQPKDEDICRPIKFKNNNVTDKPDIIFVGTYTAFTDEDEPVTLANGVCRLREGQDEAKLIGKLDSKHKDLLYDSKTNTVYESTFTYKLQVLTPNQQLVDIYDYPESVFEGSGPGLVYSMALDWVTKNLYIIRDKEIQMYNINDNTKYPKTIVKSNYSHPIIKVFPNKGYLIVKTGPANANTLTRYNQDGSEPSVLYNYTGYGNNKICAIALDYYENKIYWSENTGNKEYVISSMNLNGDDRRTFYQQDKHVRRCGKSLLQVDEKYVYFTPEIDNNNYVRARKIDGSFDKDFEIMQENASDKIQRELIAAMVVSGNPQRTANDHPCQYNNGGCDGFCVAVPNHKYSLDKKCIDTETMGFFRKAWRKITGIFG